MRTENSVPYRTHVWLLPFKRTHRDLFMPFPTLDKLVFLTAEHVYSGRPGDRLSVHGLLRSEISQQTCYLLSIQCLAGVTKTWFTLLSIFGGISCGQNNWSFSDYAVRRPFLAKVPAIPLLRFVPSSAYRHTPLHYPHGANAGCDLAGVAPVVSRLIKLIYVPQTRCVKARRRFALSEFFLWSLLIIVIVVGGNSSCSSIIIISSSSDSSSRSSISNWSIIITITISTVVAVKVLHEINLRQS